MGALLDINFIIALFDPDHSFHERAHGWWAMLGRDGWVKLAKSRIQDLGAC